MNTGNADIKLIKLRLHFIYVACILTGLVILVATFEWTTLPKFTDYLTAAGTMVSIVLGVLAIIYSFVSGDSISRSLGSVTSAADQLAAARQEFADVVDVAANLETTSKQSSTELNSVLALLRSQVNQLTDVSSQISESNAEIAKTLGTMPARFDKIDKHFEESLKGVKKQEVELSDHVDTNKVLARKMLKNASVYGTIFFYACARSVETGISFTFDVAPLGGDQEYVFGYMYASYSAGILEYDDIDEQNMKVKITKFALTSQEVIEEADSYIASKGKYANEMAQLMEDIKKVFVK